MRASGILMPVFSLPGKYGIGCFSKEAYRFVDYLSKSGQSYWQILPLGPTSYGDSPYQSFSTFAGNPYFIDLDSLIERKLLSLSQVRKTDFGADIHDIDYGKLYENRFKLLRIAFANSDVLDSDEFHDFEKKNEFWLKDYAFFMALKDHFNGKSFELWPSDIRFREDKAMQEYEELLREDIRFYEFLQFEFSLEWTRLKAYANEKGISIIGDIPIYVAYDSADVWAHPELFQVNSDGSLSGVAGCPPDAFSATGQLWGNPLYNWDYHIKTDFAWWIRRVSKCRELYDVIRIDHFRGFDEYYSIPAKDKTAEFGKWEKGPGMLLFEAIDKAMPNTRIIAEDLGYITDSVRKLVNDSGYPNMKVLEFAFDAGDSWGASDYLPCNYSKNCVVYTGTHDNETLAGWVNSISNAQIKMIREYVGNKSMPKRDLPVALIRLAQSSVADMCIIPMQDYLGLDNRARINFPSTLGTNWRWRADSGMFTSTLSKKIYALTKTYGRIRRG